MGFGGDGGLATNALLYGPSALAFDAGGNLYMSDMYRIRRISPNQIITTVAGIGTRGDSGDGGSPLAAQLYGPTGLAVDKAGNLLISDGGARKIRKIDFSAPASLTFASTMMGQTSTTQTVAIENRGNVPLAFSAIALTNAALDSSTTCLVSTPVAPGASCVLGIQFAPQAPGSPLGGVGGIDRQRAELPADDRDLRHCNRAADSAGVHRCPACDIGDGAATPEASVLR